MAFESCASRTQSQGEIISYVAHIGKREFQNHSIHGVQLYSWVSIFGLSESQRILPLILSVAKCHLLTILQFKLLPESCKASWYLIYLM